MTFQPSLLFVFGLGYSGLQFARLFLQSGGEVQGTVRSEDRLETCRDTGINAQIWKGQGPLAVPRGAHWLITVPPDASGCPVARSVADQIGDAASVSYLSTTGVYGDLAGGWAMEWSPVHPQSERAKRRVLAENQWQHASSGRARIVRLPGIYGPGRSTFDALKEGRARRVIKPGQVFSRVHVDDIASGLQALIERPAVSGVFHLCDDQPAPPQDLVTFAAELLGMEPPACVTFEEAQLSPMAKSFYAECKRVSNARTKATLNWQPAYPDYHAGLTSIFKSMENKTIQG